MIKHRIGDLFSVKEGFIVHGCNAQGVMGSGVAKIVRETYPDAFSLYRQCLEVKRELGKDPMGTNTYSMQDEERNLVIVNAITQEFYGYDGRRYTDYEAVRSCFKDLREEVERWQKIYKDVPRVVNFPLIGCDRGGGDWNVVSAIIDQELDDSFEKVLWTLE